MTESATTGTSAKSELSIFAPELSNENGQITTTSLQIAQHFGKAHGIVMRAIRNLIAQLAGDALCNFAQGSYTAPETGDQQHALYRITKDGFMLLAMGFTGKEALQWKMAYIAEFNRREAELVKLQSPTDRIPYSVNPTDTLSAAQAEQLRLIFREKCDTLPKDEQAGFMTKGWSKLKSHFGVTYRQIQQREFSEALSLASRHAAEWQVAGTVVAAPIKNALKALPMAQSTKTLQLMVITTSGGQSTVEMFPASDLPQMVLHDHDLFDANQAQQITCHANLRMMGEVSRMGRDEEFEERRKQNRKLSSEQLGILTADGYMEMGMRTALANKMGMTT